MRSRTATILALVLLALIGGRLAPRPEAQIFACGLSPAPALCDLVAVPLLGSETTAAAAPGSGAPPPAAPGSGAPPPAPPSSQEVIDYLVADRIAGAAYEGCEFMQDRRACAELADILRRRGPSWAQTAELFAHRWLPAPPPPPPAHTEPKDPPPPARLVPLPKENTQIERPPPLGPDEPKEDTRPAGYQRPPAEMSPGPDDYRANVKPQEPPPLPARGCSAAPGGRRGAGALLLVASLVVLLCGGRRAFWFLLLLGLAGCPAAYAAPREGPNQGGGTRSEGRPCRGWPYRPCRDVRPTAAPAPAPAPPPRPTQLVLGEQALLAGWHALAYRSCRAAAAESPPWRPAAYVCQGRAALGLKWTAQAVRLGHAALNLRDDDAARLLLGDAYRTAADCKSARPHYLTILEEQPEHAEAIAGLRACAGEWPPPPAPDMQQPAAAERSGVLRA